MGHEQKAIAVTISTSRREGWIANTSRVCRGVCGWHIQTVAKQKTLKNGSRFTEHF